MMEFFYRLARAVGTSSPVRSLQKKIVQSKNRLPVLNRCEVGDRIREALQQNTPFLVGKLGVTERIILCWYLGIPTRQFHTLQFRVPTFDDLHIAQQLAGIFPVNEATLKRFSQLLIDSLGEVDIIGGLVSWVETKIYNHFCPCSFYAEANRLEPFRAERPWSDALIGKKIVVISPFEASISKQFQNRDLVWGAHRDVLPDCEVRVLKFPYLFEGSEEYGSVFDVYEDFSGRLADLKSTWGWDVAVIGCGGLGLPLARCAKQLGGQGIHLGGATQLLFGVLGARWKQDLVIQSISNRYWVYPSLAERPASYLQVERGCYW